MFSCSGSGNRPWRALLVSLLLLCSATAVWAQSGDLDEEEADPVKLFERAQDEHAQGRLTEALELYAEAIKLRPEFPEAEYQRATVLVALKRLPEAEQALRRAVELRGTWAQPHALLGSLLITLGKNAEAERELERALTLEPQNRTALLALTELRLQPNTPRERLAQMLTRLGEATASGNAPAGLWLARGSVERALGERAAALSSFERALDLDPQNVAAHLERAETFASASDPARAIESAKTAQRLAPNSLKVAAALARYHLQAGNCPEATRTLDEFDAQSKQPVLTAELRNTVTLGCVTGEGERPALLAALEKEPRNASVLSRLCASYRKDDPPRALEYCRRALEIEPSSAAYATAYAAALVQARRFAEAAALLQRVIAAAPDNYAAHANLAVALYELKRFREALDEYRWLLAARPETTAAYFFIATAHDNLGEYPEALAAYETFLQRANPQQFELEIGKVNLRLPGLRQQIKLGQGAKKKT